MSCFAVRNKSDCVLLREASKANPSSYITAMMTYSKQFLAIEAALDIRNSIGSAEGDLNMLVEPWKLRWQN